MLLILALIPHILWFIGWIGCRLAGVNLPYSYFGFAAMAIVILFWGMLAYGYFVGRWNVKSVHIEYAHKDIPKAFDGFKIVHISDLHLSTFDDSHERFETFIEEINRHAPDLVCFTGDMVTVGRSEAEPYTAILRKIYARHGVLSVLGNHDFMIYGFNAENDREKAVEDLARYQRDVLGWNLLRNENAVIEAEDGSKITFLGVDNANFSNQGFRTFSPSFFPFPFRSFPKALWEKGGGPSIFFLLSSEYKRLTKIYILVIRCYTLIHVFLTNCICIT